MKRRSIIIVAVLLLVCIALTGCARITEKEEQKVIGTVTARHYTAPYVTITRVPIGRGGSSITHTHPARHMVTITYGELTTTVNDSSLYHSVKVGDQVEVTLVSGFTAEHELVKQYLQY